MRLAVLSAVVCMGLPAIALDARLEELHKTLVALRAYDPKETHAPGAQLALAKHQLRDWIETQLGPLNAPGGDKALAERINRALDAIQVKHAEEDQNSLGSLGEVTISQEPGLLIVKTAVGIMCQWDASAYGYRSVEGQWRRVWQSEEEDYSRERYKPQNWMEVQTWQGFKDGHEDGPPFVMTLGHEWGCWSTWHDVYFRVWRVDPQGAKLLIGEAAFAWLRAQGYIVGSLGGRSLASGSPVDVLIEFTQDSIDAGVHNREAVRHYLIEGDRVRRLEPVALSPRDFVDEWLSRPWSECAEWSESPKLQERHRKLHSDDVSGEFSGTTKHCQTPDLWQVGFAPWISKDISKPELGPVVYFLVQWRPPYHFRMVSTGDKPWPRCTADDPEADEWRTLFNTKDWRN